MTDDDLSLTDDDGLTVPPGEAPPPMDEEIRRELSAYLRSQSALHLALVVEVEGLGPDEARALAAELGDRLRAVGRGPGCGLHVVDQPSRRGAPLAVAAFVGPTTLDPAAPEAALAAARDALRGRGHRDWDAATTTDTTDGALLSAVWHASARPGRGPVRLHLHAGTGWALSAPQQ